MMCDIDNLKAVNDIFGHTAGDQYIKACVDALFSSVRKLDLIFRIGGDEFLVVLMDSSEGEMVKSLRKRIRKNLKLPNFPGIPPLIPLLSPPTHTNPPPSNYIKN